MYYAFLPSQPDAAGNGTYKLAIPTVSLIYPMLPGKKVWQEDLITGLLACIGSFLFATGLFSSLQAAFGTLKLLFCCNL